jgi:hypothetical protein
MYQVTEMLNKKIHQIIQNDLMFYLITVMIVIMLKENKMKISVDHGVGKPPKLPLLHFLWVWQQCWDKILSHSLSFKIRRFLM